MTDLRARLANELHVWVVALDVTDAALTVLGAALSADERGRAGRSHFERDRRRFVAARAILRRILGQRYLGREPAELRFGYGANGKPSLMHPGLDGTPPPAVPTTAELQFNLAHADDLALVAVAEGRRVGVDVERLRPLPDLDGLAATVLTAGERAALRHVPDPDRARAFLTVWTRKEAFLKATGEGLGRAPDTFEVTVRPGDPPRLLAVDGDAGAATPWAVRDVDVPAGYVGALVVERPAPGLRVLRWPATGA